MRLPLVARLGIVVSLAALTAVGVRDAHAQNVPAGPAEPKLGWSNTTDLSLVLTSGNSDSNTLGFSDQLHHVWSNARLELEINTTRSNKSDDRYFLVDPGLEFPVGGAPASAPTSLVKPEPTLDVSNYLIRAAFERRLSPRWFWNAGTSWYRNDDAGIINRYITFAGVGNTWWNSQRRRFVTSYGISYTDREEEDPDPEKDRRFAGGRASWDYTERFTATTTFDSDLAVNGNLSDRSDYSMSTINAVTVSVNHHVSLKVSFQWLFENEPALENDLDVIAHVELINPDGMPSSGDERFRTLESGGTKLVLGSDDARKDKLDTLVRTALVISF